MSTLPLPSGLSWPECDKCGEPVTERQRVAGRFTVLEGIGIFHSKCHAIVLMHFERQIEEVTP